MEPVGTKVQVPGGMQPFQTLGNVVNMAQTLQQMQRGNVALQTEQMVLGERQKGSEYLRNPANYTGENGEVNFPKMIRDLSQLMPTTYPEYVGKIAEAQKAGTLARHAMNTASAEERKQAAELAHGLIGQPKPVIAERFAAFSKDNPNLKPAFDTLLNFYVNPAQDQRGVDFGLSAFGRSVQGMAEQQAALRGQYANTGGQLTQIDPTAKLAGQQPSALPLTLPPGERENVGVHPVTQEYVTTAKDPQGRVTGVSQTPQSQEVMRPKPGEGAAIQHNAQTMAKDFSTTLEEGQNAGRSISALQEIRKYAPGAVTGIAQEKRQFAQKLFAWLGLDYSEKAAADTDLLAKNSNMLAAAGGNTDLARVLAEAANPNVKMEKGAILRAVDQVLGQQQLKLARAHYLQQFTRDPSSYAQAVTEFNRVADPRVFEYPNWSQEEKISQKANMNPSERKAFGEALRFFQSKGYLR